MNNQPVFYILNEDNQAISSALDPIYLIHMLVRNYGLENFAIKQQPDNTAITANLFMTGNTHSEQPAYRVQQVLYLQDIKCDNSNYKMVVYLVQTEQEEEK